MKECNAQLDHKCPPWPRVPEDWLSPVPRLQTGFKR